MSEHKEAVKLVSYNRLKKRGEGVTNMKEPSVVENQWITQGDINYLKFTTAKTYKYRGELIMKHLKKPGWWCTSTDGTDTNLYKTIDDCKRAIDNRLGGWSGQNPVKRWHNKPIQIIGTWFEE